ncbi:MAG: outer membrane beta-barrel protein [Candidatus Omnitrophota bacterium]
MEKILKRFLSVCLIGMCFCPGVVFGESLETAPGVQATEIAPAPVASPDRGLLMSLLDWAGIGQTLDKAGIKIYGYSEAGIMFDPTAGRNGAGPTFLGFNYFKNTPMLNKISLNVERTVDPSKKAFDVGFRLEGIWGTDAKFIHANGIADTQTGRYQMDPLQAYVDVTTPYLPIRIRAGKWIELAGFEHFSANIYGAFGDPARAFYSYSYQFLYAEPGTQTGVLGTYVLNPQWSFDLGITDGWNQCTRDANHYADILGRITFTPNDKTAFIFTMTEGPEYPTGVGRGLPPGDNKDWWTAMDFVATRKVTEKLSLGLGGDFVNAPHIPGLSKGAKQWGGVAGYASYALNKFVTANSRLEWYIDAANGFSNGASTRANYYEATLGPAIKPFANKKFLSQVIVRPELRFDFSNQPVFAKGDKMQVSLSADILYTF